jgi:putative sigma-54 modulation protein
MEAQIQFVHTSPNDDLEVMVRDRLEKLTAKYKWIVRAKVILKREKNPNARTRSCEIELSIPELKNIFEEAHELSFERAIVESFKKLQRQLRKLKEKKYQHLN